MDFFAEQRRATSQSKRLLLLFLVAVVLISLAVGGVAATAYSMLGEGGLASGPVYASELIPIAATFALIALAVIALASLVKSASLRAGGRVVAEQLGGTLIPSDTTNPSYRRLRNVVEEMAIASGVPVPEIYVLEQEAGINAFAAGYTPADAAVGVTRGCLEQLSRAELQAVIAHEFSHIMNGDMRLNIRLMGLLFGILALSVMARNVLRFSRGARSDSRGAAPLLVVALLVMVIGSIGVFFGRLIKAAVSRQREYLADASAVQFTRDNLAVSGALKKIAVLAEGSLLLSPDAEEVSHMLFGDGVGYSNLFATHPPLMARIQRLEPGFDAEQLGRLAEQWRQPGRAHRDAEEAGDLAGARERFPGGLGSLPGTAALPPGTLEILVGGAAGLPLPTDPDQPKRRSAGAQLASRVASPGLDHVRYAELLRAELPEALVQAAQRRDSAPDLVLAILVGSAGGGFDRHLQLIETHRGGDSRRTVESLLPRLAGLHPVQRAPMLAIAFPALKRRPRAELDDFIDTVDALAHLDGEVTVFEYALVRELRIRLIEAADPARARLFGNARLEELQADAAAMLAVMAAQGHVDPDAARRAYLMGMHALLPRSNIAYTPRPDWIATLDKVLPSLDRLDPPGKALLLEALLVTLHHDQHITVEEAEILRAVSASLHCPMPPLLPE